MTKTIAIVDEDKLSGGPSTFLLVASAGHHVYTFANGKAFLAAELPQPADCVLLDIRLPGADGLDVLRALARREDPPAVVVTSDSGDIPLAVQAMKLGAADFLEKPCRPAVLLDAIAQACARRDQLLLAAKAQRQAAARLALLSDRMRQVLRGMGLGRANKAIAHELGLSVRTVEAYRAQLFARLGVRTTAEAVSIAFAAGVSAFNPDSPTASEAGRCRWP